MLCWFYWLFFMVTAPLITQGVQVDLPTASTKPLPKEDEMPVVVTVDNKGDIYLNIFSKTKKFYNC